MTSKTKKILLIATGAGAVGLLVWYFMKGTGASNPVGPVTPPDSKDATITGYVTGVENIFGYGEPLPGIVVTLLGSDGVKKTVQTGATGSYSFVVVKGWSGTITPAKEGIIFSPATISLSNVTENKTNQNFIGTYSEDPYIPPENKYIVSGFITDATTKAGISGVTVTLSSLLIPNQTSITNSEGYYSFSVSQNMGGTLTPTKEKYTFTPSSKSFNVLTMNIENQNFTGVSEEPTIPDDPVFPETCLAMVYVMEDPDSSGRTPIEDAVITFTGGVEATTIVEVVIPDRGAVYKNLPGGWSGTITPSSPTHTFTPSNLTISHISEDIAQLFVGKPK